MGVNGLIGLALEISLLNRNTIKLVMVIVRLCLILADSRVVGLKLEIG